LEVDLLLNFSTMSSFQTPGGRWRLWPE